MKPHQTEQSRSFFNVDWEAELDEQITETEREILTKIAQRIVDMNMVVPAIMFLEPMKPLNYLSSQALLFLEPFTAYVLGFQEMIAFRRALSKRESVEILINEIERIADSGKPKGKPILRALTTDVGDLFKKRFGKNKNKG